MMSSSEAWARLIILAVSSDDLFSWCGPGLNRRHMDFQSVTPLDRQISNYLTQLNSRQKKAVLTVVRTFAEEQEQESSPWKDVGFVAEMDRRMAALESGKVKGYTWHEVKQRARNSKNRKEENELSAGFPSRIRFELA